ncbi:MAG: TetR/AcrR family transcriptional regulator [Rhodobacteraceae bacterium]|nr:TetR/AcrR family transcriptional regulator [Paracoccaceae bacterium]
MANVRKFDEEAVLDQILQVFWRKGYDASLDDLVAATGLKRQSLYNAFGGKDAMFDIAFQRYLSRFEQEERAVAASTASCRERIKQVLALLAASALDDATPPGCLVANCVTEFADRSDHPIRDAARRRMARLEGFLTGILEQGAAQGELREGADPKALARLLVAAIVGNAAMYRLERDKSFVEDVARAAVNSVI